MTIDFSRYADNVYYRHIERFRDTWLRRNLRGHVGIRETHAAYDEFCRRNNIVHRKITVPELQVELARIGVRIGHIGRGWERRPAYVTWCLTKEASRATAGVARPGIDEHRYTPIGRLRGEDDE